MEQISRGHSDPRGQRTREARTPAANWNVGLGVLGRAMTASVNVIHMPYRGQGPARSSWHRDTAACPLKFLHRREIVRTVINLNFLTSLTFTHC